MKILICSDGMPASENAIELAALLTVPLQAEITLLGITEKLSDERPLREALERQAQSLRTPNAQPNIVVRAGEPVRQIFNQTSNTSYDLVVVGARWTGATGQYWRSERTYEVIKTIQPPVLVAIGEPKRLKRFLVCTGGKEFIERAVQFTGEIAAAVRASAKWITASSSSGDAGLRSSPTSTPARHSPPTYERTSWTPTHNLQMRATNE